MSTPPPNQPPSWGQPPQQPSPGWGQQPPNSPNKSGAGKKVGLGCLGVIGAIILVGAIGAALDKKSGTATVATATSPAAKAPAPAGPASQGPPAPAASAPAAPPPTSADPVAQHTVTFVVSGASDADVQYGSAGSTDQGHSPMNISQPLGNPLYYSISAQLQGAGKVSCELQVDGQTISQASANGGYNIATCEISKDPLTGEWKDTNQG